MTDQSEIGNRPSAIPLPELEQWVWDLLGEAVRLRRQTERVTREAAGKAVELMRLSLADGSGATETEVVVRHNLARHVNERAGQFMEITTMEQEVRRWFRRRDGKAVGG